MRKLLVVSLALNVLVAAAHAWFGDGPGRTALMRAYRVSERAARTGFDWNDLGEVMEKVEEEWGEFKSAARDLSTAADREAAAVEFGDIIFTLANVARFLKFHPETALTTAIQKFEQRFRYMEKAFHERGHDLEAASRREMDAAWDDAKQRATPQV